MQTSARFAIKSCVYFCSWILYIFPPSNYHSLHISTLPFNITLIDARCMYFSESQTLLLWCPLMAHLTERVILAWHINMIKLELDFDHHRFRILILPKPKCHWWSDLGDWGCSPWLSADQWSVVTSVGLAPCVSWPPPVLITRDTGHYELQAGSHHPAPQHWPGTRCSGPSYLTTRVHRGLSLRRLLITNWSRYTGQGRPALSRQLDHFTRYEKMMF